MTMKDNVLDEGCGHTSQTDLPAVRASDRVDLLLISREISKMLFSFDDDKSVAAC